MDIVALTPVISAYGRLRAEDDEFKANLVRPHGQK